MKKILNVLYAFITLCLLSNCGNTDNEPIVEPFKPSIVILDQAFRYRNKTGENLLANGVYKDKFLSIIRTDENYNDVYINGQLQADIKNHLEIIEKGEDLLVIGFATFHHIDKENKTAIGHYKLKYDENKYDTITVHFYFNLKGGIKMYITKVIYNGVEYPYSPAPIIIVKDE